MRLTAGPGGDKYVDASNISNSDAPVISVVKEGRLGRSPKASQSALPGQKCPRLPSREGKLGRFRPSLPSLEGKLGRPSQIALPGGQSGDSLPH